MLCWWQGNSREKSHSFFLPHFVCVLDEEQPERFWSRSKFYSISLNGNKQNHSILLSIPPGVIRKTFVFEGRPWELLWDLLWLHSLNKKMLALLKLLWVVISIPVALEREMADTHQTEGLNSHWMLFGWKEDGKIGSNSFWKKEKTLLKCHSIYRRNYFVT